MARPARLLRGLRLALVLGDLPAALRLARRLRAAAHARCTGRPCAPSRRARPAPAGAAAPRTPSRRSTATVEEALRGGRGRCCAASAFRVARPRRRALAQRRERLPARDRQPGLPPRADRASSSASRSGTCSAGGATSSSGRARRSANTLSPLRHASAPGPWVDAEDLSPVHVTVDKLDATSRSGPRGAASSARRATSRAHVTTTDGPAARRAQADDQVNHPLEIGRRRRSSCSATATPPSSRCATRRARCSTATPTPFLAAGQQLHVRRRDQGARRRRPKQLGFTGFFLPTAESIDANGPAARSSPTPTNPELALSACARATSSPGAGPQSVYTLDTEQDDSRARPRTATPLLHPARAGPDLPAARRPRVDHLRQGRAVRRAVDPLPTRARRSPWSRRCSRSPG